MAAPNTAHNAFSSRQYTSTLTRPQNQYSSAAYHVYKPFQPLQPQQGFASVASSQQQPRVNLQADRERANQDELHGITEEQHNEVYEAFALFDLDKDDHIDYHETQVAFKALGFELPKGEIVNLLQTYGVTNQAQGKAQGIQQATFMGPNRLLLPFAVFQGEAARRIAARDPENEIMRAFDLFDTEGKGRIDLDDLVRVAREVGEGWGEQELRSMIEEFDVRGEGGINRDEFIGICLE